MFRLHSKPLGPPELLASLLTLSSLSNPLSNRTLHAVLTPDDIPLFLNDLAQRFEPDGELVNVLGPTVKMLLFHDSLARREGLGGADQGWRNVMSGLEALVSVKPIAIMLTQMEEWNPQA